MKTKILIALIIPVVVAIVLVLAFLISPKAEHDSIPLEKNLEETFPTSTSAVNSEQATTSLSDWVATATQGVALEQSKIIIEAIQAKIRTISSVSQVLKFVTSNKAEGKETVLSQSTTNKDLTGAKAWDFSKRAEIVERDLGVEEINGVFCKHYKLGIKTIPYTSKTEEDEYFIHGVIGINPGDSQVQAITYQSGKYSRSHQLTIDGKTLNLTIPNEIAMPIMYVAVSQPDQKDKSVYAIDTWSITGEIWVDEATSLVHKEKYTSEHGRFYFSSNAEESKKTEVGFVFQNNSEATYSNFK